MSLVDSTPTVHLHLCEGHELQKVRLLPGSADAIGEDNIWRIERVEEGPTPPDLDVVIGSRPSGFDATVPFHGFPDPSSGVVLMVEQFPGPTYFASFVPSELSEGAVKSSKRGILPRSEFDEQARLDCAGSPPWIVAMWEVALLVSFVLVVVRSRIRRALVALVVSGAAFGFLSDVLLRRPLEEAVVGAVSAATLATAITFARGWRGESAGTRVPPSRARQRIRYVILAGACSAYATWILKREDRWMAVGAVFLVAVALVGGVLQSTSQRAPQQE